MKTTWDGKLLTFGLKIVNACSKKVYIYIRMYVYLIITRTSLSSWNGAR